MGNRGSKNQSIPVKQGKQTGCFESFKTLCCCCCQDNSDNCCPLFRNKCRDDMACPRHPEGHNLPTNFVNEEKPKPTPAPQEDAGSLRITSWDWCHTKNGSDHHTSKYHGMDTKDSGLVVRRGQEFSLVLNTSRQYSPDEDKVGLVITVRDCKNPQFGNGTQEGLLLGDPEEEGDWAVTVEDVSEAQIQLKIRSPPTCIVGEWTVEADITSGGETHNFPCPQNIFVLFNPWAEDDAVFMDDADHREEYVASDTGLIWRGTSNSNRPCPWAYGQYQKGVLQSVLYVLHSVCRMSAVHRANPILVSRSISAGINSPDDKGVLVGNWSGEYEGGKSPTTWSGSADILTQFLEKKEPVKFGQCWVFAGVVAAACRAIGLPCRPVTNFSSAHDTHNSLTIDYFFDEEGEVIERLNSDSIWNFHVWNECWMKRKDLGEAYAGWQIIDATPQEESDGQYRCGPTSQSAVRKGMVDLPYDGPFVYAEVNADKLFWKYTGKDKPLKLIGKKTSGIGLNVSTKAVGRWGRDDITDQYKHCEVTESDKERKAMKNALRRCNAAFARYYLNQDVEDIQLKMLSTSDDMLIGHNLPMKVKVENKSDKEQTVSVVLRADATLYTGRVTGCVKKQTFTETIPPNEETTFTVDTPYEEYASHLRDQSSFRVSCLASIPDTEYEYFNEDDFRMKKPDIDIKPTTEWGLGAPTKCEVSFVNPLPVPLTRACFYVMASKCASQFVRIREPIAAGGSAQCEVELVPTSCGEVVVTATFLSKELDDVDGYYSVTVAEAE